MFHDIRGYDSHLMIKEISKFDVKVSVTPNGLEKYMAFTINTNLIFIDSMQFMNSSLDLLVKNLSDNGFKYLSGEFSGEFLNLVKQKGVYSYEYMDSFKKFSKNNLPNRCKFFSSLKDKYISEKDYLKGDNIWNVFKMNTMGDHHDLYLKKDVLLLANLFAKFINTCLDWLGLMLKMTRIELDLIPNIDMHFFTEKGMRGGISYIAKRHSKANDKYMECYDSSKQSKYITYHGGNNLYGWALCRYLPYSRFKWLNQKEIDRFDVNSIERNSSIGYILEIDLEYPSKLHKLHNDDPLAPEKLKISCQICGQIIVLVSQMNMESKWVELIN